MSPSLPLKLQAQASSLWDTLTSPAFIEQPQWSITAFSPGLSTGLCCWYHENFCLQWNLDNSNRRGPPKKVCYEKFELWVMLSLCVSHVTTVVSPFHSSVFHFLAKFSKICEIFYSCEKKTMKLCLLHKNVNTSSHRKGNLTALTAVYQFELWLNVRDMPSKLSLPGQGPWSLVWAKQVFELSEVELTEFRCIINLNQCLFWLFTTCF